MYNTPKLAENFYTGKIDIEKILSPKLPCLKDRTRRCDCHLNSRQARDEILHDQERHSGKPLSDYCPKKHGTFSGLHGILPLISKIARRIRVR